MGGLLKNTVFSTKVAESAPGFSYWESKGWLNEPDAVVVGAGLVGMNAAPVSYTHLTLPTKA